MSTPYGKTQVVQADLQQTPLNSIDRSALIIGVAADATAQDEFIAVNRASDLGALLGTADSELKSQVIAARANAGADWMTYVLPYTYRASQAAAGETPAVEEHNAVDALNAALLAAGGELPPVELIAFATPLTTKAQVEELAVLHTDLASRSRDVVILFALEGISNAQSWTQYKTAMDAIIGEIEHDALVPVAQLHGNNLGCLLGRLTTNKASIADSPLRVETGSVVGLGADPADKDGVVFGDAQMIDLCSIRLNSPQRYTDIEGTYWTGVSTLAAPTSDFAPIEHKRIFNKSARIQRRLVVSIIGNRRVNNSVSSMANLKAKVRKAHEPMEKSYGGHQPDIEPTTDDSFRFEWPTRGTLLIYNKLRPYGYPHDITSVVQLDLANYTSDL